MNDIRKLISDIGIVPVIAIEDAGKAVDLAGALERGGLPAAEVTFRTAAGEEAIRRIARECPNVLVGAGTILNLEQCDRAVAAGAKFIVSPGYNEALVSHCVENNIPVFPGCVNASDMTRAVNAGLKVVKFFPAEQSGGVGFLKSLAPVLPLDFMPTGGVNTKNLLDYLSFERVVACGGTWMVKKDLIEGERWDEIEAICKEAVKTMLGFNLQHVGIPCGDAEKAAATAKAIAAIFGLPYKPGNSSDFAAPYVECCKVPFPGERGHLAIGTYNVDRAIYHLGLQGVRFLEETRKTDGKGNTKVIYIDGEFGGFAIHLVKR